MRRPVWPPPAVIVEGPDGCGKTEISQDLARRLGFPYFKVSTERKNWRDGTFSRSLYFDSLLPQFIAAAVEPGVVLDRSYPSEWVYSSVFSRDTDEDLLRHTDEEFFAIGAVVVLLLRRDYSKNRQDDLVPPEMLDEIHDGYVGFTLWTRCPVVMMYVGDYNDDVDRQVPELMRRLRATYENELGEWERREVTG